MRYYWMDLISKLADLLSVIRCRGGVAPMIQRSYTVASSFPSLCVLTGLIGSIRFQNHLLPWILAPNFSESTWPERGIERTQTPLLAFATTTRALDTAPLEL